MLGKNCGWLWYIGSREYTFFFQMPLLGNGNCKTEFNSDAKWNPRFRPTLGNALLHDTPKPPPEPMLIDNIGSPVPFNNKQFNWKCWLYQALMWFKKNANLRLQPHCPRANEVSISGPEQYDRDFADQVKKLMTPTTNVLCHTCISKLT